MAHPALIELCLEWLAPLGPVRARRMFGAHGIYVGELFIAILSADQLYLKTDALTRPTFEATGGLPFVYEARGKRVALSFSTPPVDALDSAEAMAPWGRLALAAARRGHLQRVATSARRTAPRRPARRAGRTMPPCDAPAADHPLSAVAAGPARRLSNPRMPVTLSSLWRPAAAAVLAALLAPLNSPAAPGDEALVEAREAWRKGDRPRLLRLGQQLAQAGNPLAAWADYWELSSRLPQADSDEVERFYARWSGSYVEDRLRNDWLLELGRRRDAASFAREFPRFRMNDDREVSCYAWLFEAEAGRDVRAQALAAWQAQREADEGCQALATHLRNSGQIGPAELWLRLRVAVEQGRQRTARAAAQLIGAEVVKAVDALWDNPARFLARPTGGERTQLAALQVLAVMRMAATDPAVAARQLESAWAQALKAPWPAAAWGAVARQATLRQLDEAAGWAETALRLHQQTPAPFGLTDDVLAWAARAHLRRVAADPTAWTQVAAAIAAMSPTERAEPTWSYWMARALRARSRPGSAGDATMGEARALLEPIASPLHFYGQLALEELGQRPDLPPPPAPLSDGEQAAAAAHPGLQRALRLMDIGLRSEGVREWNFTLIGMDDRRLLAAAQLACSQQVWDRCINSSDRSQGLVDLQQRYPLPWREEIASAATQAGLPPALVFGLIRQESRFVTQARSHVGASGLMQVMPATARWTAKRLGLEWKPEWRDDRVINLRLGTSYLRMVLDDFGGSWPMALAAYNAGPNRPRRWREGATMEPAAWAETIPIHETRDYVKKVLANASIYAHRLGQSPAPALKTLLGRPVGPREADAPEPNKELP